uniref:Uncharacterized protein n=1 Tax=Cacopsylla melanoneura TaxID=428564 RepID=A0A8D8QKA4_9HEMI
MTTGCNLETNQLRTLSTRTVQATGRFQHNTFRCTCFSRSFFFILPLNGQLIPGFCKTYAHSLICVCTDTELGLIIPHSQVMNQTNIIIFINIFHVSVEFSEASILHMQHFLIAFKVQLSTLLHMY